jgi:hypothetical protein
MSAYIKLRPGNSELTKLKAVWRGLGADARAFWQDLFVSATPQAEIRRQLATQLKVNLGRDQQLSRFRDWEGEQREMDLEAERQREDERRLKEEFGDWTLEQIREEVLKRAYTRALLRGDFSAGRKTIAQDLKVKKVSLDERRLVLLEKKAAAADRAQAALAEGKKSKGGLTRETLKKIEAELNLL